MFNLPTLKGDGFIMTQFRRGTQARAIAVRADEARQALIRRAFIAASAALALAAGMGVVLGGF